MAFVLVKSPLTKQGEVAEWGKIWLPKGREEPRGTDAASGRATRWGMPPGPSRDEGRARIGEAVPLRIKERMRHRAYVVKAAQS